MTSILGLTGEGVLSAFRTLRLVLYVSEASGLASALDPSPLDYALDRIRSGDFFRDWPQHNPCLTHHFFNSTKVYLRFNNCNFEL